MKASIDVSDAKEAELIRAGLSDPAVRAVVKVMGALKPLPSQRARARALDYVRDYFDEVQQTASIKKEKAK